MKSNIIVNFVFKSDKGANVIGQIYLVESNGVLFKANKVVILSGMLDIAHRNNEGVSSKNHRENKDKIIKDFCEEKTGSLLAYVKKPFILCNEPTGMVKIISILNGYNSNKNGLLFANEDGIKNLKLGLLFQRLKSEQQLEVCEIKSWHEFCNFNDKYVKGLKAAYKLDVSASKIMEELNYE